MNHEEIIKYTGNEREGETKVEIQTEGLEYQHIRGFIETYNRWPCDLLSRSHKRSINGLDERDDTITRVKWKEDLVRKQKPYDISVTCRSAFGHMGEEREEKRVRGD